MAALTSYPEAEDSYSKADDWCLLGKSSSHLQGTEVSSQGSSLAHLVITWCKVHVASAEPEALGTNLPLHSQF